MKSFASAPPVARPWRRSPFGPVVGGSEAPLTATLPDAVRRCRWIAVDLVAEAFSLFHADPSLENGGLVACFDSDYPAVAAMTRRLAEAASSELAAHAMRSSVPRWWANDASSAAAVAFARIPHLERIAPPIPGPAALAFPVHGERGQCGLVLFYGDAMQIEPDDLFDFHARCYALFAAVARIRPGGGLPSLTRREQECLKLTANGCTSDDIARLLNLSVHTTNQYLANTTQKLNAVNRMHAVAKALRLGLIE